MSALGIPQIAVVHGMSVAGELVGFCLRCYPCKRNLDKVAPMCLLWQMRIS